ncbi:hypothetical protein QTJ16_007069 [Diplocarpon rosae]|uniref:Peptide hydrolase n=1 Tax=Diplocarpon rosae TaxID=946125 RepID=A0AAD9STN1_9HELO|nr:hypothetical protein QTJ16_007069 [Diplocarpon rosae]
MKLTTISLLTLAAVANARFIEKHETDQVVINAAAVEDKRYLIELSPGKTLWNGQNFMDITTTPSLGYSTSSKKSPNFPSKPTLQKQLKPLIAQLEKKNLRANLETFSAFHTRYYKSDYGRQSSEWLLAKVQKTIKDAGADKHGAHAVHFKHPWGQNSIIATIPGASNATVVIGAHQDSINLFLPSIFSAPGADDDGSGTVTILEALRVLLTSEDVGGLLGSQAIFTEYERTGRDVKAMLQQDMTGYVQGTLDQGKEESVGVITDFVDGALTDFIKSVVTEYCTIPFVETKCGYACSDHASASKAGYPSAFVIESAFSDSDKRIHTSDDTIAYLSFDHMLQHARLTLGLVYELAFADL